MTVSNLADIPAQNSLAVKPVSHDSSKDDIQQKIGTGLDFSGIMASRNAGKLSNGFDNNLSESIKTSDSKPNSQKTQNNTATDKEGKALYEKSAIRNTDKVAEKVVEDTSASPEDAMKALDGYEKEVRDLLEEKLKITDEELDQALENLGLQFVDLLIPKNASLLLSNLTGKEDPAAVLLDSNLSDTMNRLMEMGRELMDGTGYTLLDLKSLDSKDGILLDENMVGVEDGEISQKDLDVITSKLEDAKASALAETGSDPARETFAAESKPIPSEEDLTEPKNLDAKEVEGEIQEDPLGLSDDSSDDVEVVEVNPGDSSKEENGQNTSEQNLSRSFENPGHVSNVEPRGGEIPLDTEIRPEDPVHTYTSAETRDMIEQIVTNVRVQNLESAHSMEMTLNPQNLGKLFMQVTEKDGMVHAKIITENENVKNALETQMAELKESINQQSMKVHEIEISVGTRAFDNREEHTEQAAFGAEAGNQNTSQEGGEESSNTRHHRNINMNHLDEMEGDLTDSEKLEVSMMRTNGNTVNLHA